MKHVAGKAKTARKGWKAKSVRPTNKGEHLSIDPAPCFYFDSCKQVSVVCKNGKSLCRKCADKVSGVEYLLRVPLRPELRGLDNWLNMRGVMSLSPMRNVF